MGDVIYNSVRSEVRSGYIEQVRRIAPAELRGREKELARLAAFCTDTNTDTESSYIWCRGSAWTGKTALLSSFVLHAPEGVEIIAFFITGRLSGQDDSVTFSEVVLEQLLDLLGQEIPPFMTEATKEAHLLRLLNEAAEMMQDCGKRLILVVDGLDEDRSVRSGEEPHSIAALLPIRPVCGMRVVVAGRPDPPIPDDVPIGHPLRDPRVIWEIPTSPQAQAVKSDALRDLKRLLRGSALEKDLVGFIAASGGGLSGPDLVSLTGCQPWEIEEHLHSVTGRSFMQRPSHWFSQDATVYLFAHEELQKLAVQAVGKDLLSDYRYRLNSWAADYRSKGWPVDTPEYLLRGYYRMLINARDLSEIMRCATDFVRHDRMLSISGSDLSAMAEIAAAQEMLQSQDAVDLTSMAELSMHRDYLGNRNANMPTELPSVWVKIEEFDRAEALARTFIRPRQRDSALSSVAKELAKRQLISRAQSVVDSIGNRFARSDALVAIVAAKLSSGELDQAADLARSIDVPVKQFKALSEVAISMAAAGERALSINIVQEVKNAIRRVDALTSMAVAAAAAGMTRWSNELIDSAESLARSLEKQTHRVRALALVAHASMLCGHTERARKLSRIVESTAMEIESSESRAHPLLIVALNYAAVGLPVDAERTAREISGASQRARALAEVASTLGMGGDFSRAKELGQAALSVSREVKKPQTLDKTLVAVVKGVLAGGDIDLAWEISRSISNASQRNSALSIVASSLAAAGRLDQVMEIVRGVDSRTHQAYILTLVGGQLATDGNFDGAIELATAAQSISSAVPTPKLQAASAVSIVEALAVGGQMELAEGIAHGIESATHKEIALCLVAEGLISSGDLRRAEELARNVTDPNRQAKIAIEVIRALIDANDKDGARRLADAILERDRQGLPCVMAVRVWIAVGELRMAEERARAANNPTNKAESLAYLARARVLAGDTDHAEDLSNEVLSLIAGSRSTVRYSRIVGLVAQACVASGHFDKAMNIAKTGGNRRAKGGMLMDLARFSAQIGSWDFAFSLVELSPNHRSEILITIAQVSAREESGSRVAVLLSGVDETNLPARSLAGLAEIVELSEARQLVARSFSSGWWTIPLRSMARVDPAALNAFVEKVIGAKMIGVEGSPALH
ncbi:hypothetical protein [Streptomyces antibioticus]